VLLSKEEDYSSEPNPNTLKSIIPMSGIIAETKNHTLIGNKLRHTRSKLLNNEAIESMILLVVALALVSVSSMKICCRIGE